MLQESSLIPMGEAESAFACSLCFAPLSKADQIDLCDGEADDMLNEVECPACGDYFDITGVEVRVHPDTSNLLDMKTALEAEWYHVSWSANWHNSILQEEDIPYVHAGNRQSAVERYEGLYKGCKAYLYKFKIAPSANLTPTVFDDLNDWPQTVSYPMGMPSQQGRTVDGFRYINRWESPGSVSLMIDPQHIIDVSCEVILIEKELQPV